MRGRRAKTVEWILEFPVFRPLFGIKAICRKEAYRYRLLKIGGTTFTPHAIVKMPLG